MFKRTSNWFGNLPIGRKLTFGFGFLIVLLLIAIISYQAIEVFVSNPANRSLADAADEVLLATRVGFSFDRARYEERIFETYYREAGFDAERLGSAYPVVLSHLSDALDLLDTVTASDTSDRVVAVRGSLESYRANVAEIVDNLLPARGTMTTGMGLSIVEPLNTIGADFDTEEAKGYVSDYLLNFNTESAIAFSSNISDLKQAIADSDLSASRKEELSAQVDSSLAAFRALMSHDAKIIQNYVAITDASGTLATELSDYIAEEENQQSKAQQRLDDANRLRAYLGWTIALLTVLIGLVMGRLIAQSISKPVVELGNVARKVAEGDYSQRAAITSSDEVGQLARTFNTTIAAVSEREVQLREQTNQLRIATAQAREAARIKGEFLANVSHELRTPLNAIIGFSDMLLMGMNGELNEKQSHKIRRLRENGIRLLDLINDILDLTRIEARRVELMPHPFAPRALFTRVSGQMDVLAQEKGLAFTTDISPDLPETLVGDEKRIEQIVVNLLSNAFKFTQEGSVALSTQVNLAEKTWSIKVSDTGVGIPPHARNLIFEEFRQLDGTSTRAYKGTGLGLAITRNLVRIMSGDITVESELSKGSTFTVTLPLSTEDVSNVNTVVLESVEA